MEIAQRAAAMALCLALLTLSSVSFASEEAHPDWPCIQRRVPVISAATMWSEPVLDPEKANDWRKDKAISELVKRLALRRVTIEEAGDLVEKFAMSLNDEERLQKLPLVFQGVLQSINKERAAIIRGIERFTRKQRVLADDVRKSRGELEKALAEASDGPARDAAQQKLDWQTRIHKEREKSLEFVCESPILLEQRAFALAREIQYRLP